MPLKTDELVKAFELIEKSELNCTIKGSWKGAQLCGITVFASSLCFGPVGAIYGGIIGGLAASVCFKFDSVSYVIKHKLSEDQKEKILELISEATEDVVIEDAVVLFKYLMGNPQIIEKLLNYLRLFGINVSPDYEKLYLKMSSNVN